MYLARKKTERIVHRISRKEANVLQINLMLIKRKTLLLRKESKRFAFRSEQSRQRKTLLYDVLDRLLKRGFARRPQGIL